MNKKGATQASDFTEIVIAVVLILIALFLLFFVANQRKVQTTNTISQVESEAIRLQAVRTYIQTPISYKGSSLSIGEVINEYYSLSLKNSLNRTEQTRRRDLRSLIYSTARESFDPLAYQKLYDYFSVTIKLYDTSGDVGSYYWLDLVISPSSKKHPISDLNITLPAKLGTKYEQPGDYNIFIEIH